MFWRLAPVFALIAAPAVAREWPTTGGWSVGESGSDMCAMALEYEGAGSTVVTLGLGIDGRIMLIATNHGWSAKKDQAYDLEFHLNGTAYSGAKSIGIVNGLRKGFITSFNPDFLPHFAASTYLTIKSSDGVTIDDLKLDGSAAALTQLRRCVAHLKAVAAVEARERARLAHIPRDPFAVVTGDPPAPAQPTAVAYPARARANLSSYVSDADYPDSAIRAAEQGTTGFRLDVGADGRVSNCTIILSSGSSALDATTCRIMRSRARFTPARDGSGAAQPDTVHDRVTWVLPPS